MTNQILPSPQDLRKQAKAISKVEGAVLSYEDALYNLLNHFSCENEEEYAQRFQVQQYELEGQGNGIECVEQYARAQLQQALLDPRIRHGLASAVLEFVHHRTVSYLAQKQSKAVIEDIKLYLVTPPDDELLAVVESVYKDTSPAADLQEYWIKAVEFAGLSFNVLMDLAMDSKSRKRALREYADTDIEGLAASEAFSQMINHAANETLWFQLP